jgi:hypothetical protein
MPKSEEVLSSERQKSDTRAFDDHAEHAGAVKVAKRASVGYPHTDNFYYQAGTGGIVPHEKIFKEGFAMFDDFEDIAESVASMESELADMPNALAAPSEDARLDQAEEALAAAMLVRDLATSDELAELAEDYTAMGEVSDAAQIAMERTIVRLDRDARFRHLRKANTLSLARKANHPKFRKLMTIWKIERQLEGELDQIYRTKATSLARQQIKNYAANGKKKLARVNPSNEVGKGRVSGKIAQRAVNATKGKFGKEQLAVDHAKK